MGLFVQCPNTKCRKRNGERTLLKAKATGKGNGNTCLNCGHSLIHPVLRHKVYGVEYRDSSKTLTREINQNWTRQEALYRFQEVSQAKARGDYIPQNPETKTSFCDLAYWYLELDKVKAKRSYDRDRRSIGKLCDFFGKHVLKDINPAMVEKYIHKRLSEPSYRGHLTRPATVVRELACLNHIYTNALRNGKAERNPAKGVKRPPENNERDRVLSREEYGRLIAECPSYIESVIKLAYHTGMRRGEVLGLTWEKVDLKEGFIRLSPEDTKTSEGREVPLCPELLEMFRSMPRGLPGVPVFTHKGKPITGSTIRVGLGIACKRAGVKDFTFHDFRHTFNTNLYLAGVPIPTIMAITGHKSLVMFKRYTTIAKEDKKAAVKKINGYVHQKFTVGGF